jgi:hypothetical protein
LAIIERVLGPEHLDMMMSRNNLTDVLNAQGKHVEAEQEHRAISAIMKRVLGPKHPTVFLSSYNLTECLKAQGKKFEAWSLHGGLR